MTSMLGRLTSCAVALVIGVAAAGAGAAEQPSPPFGPAPGALLATQKRAANPTTSPELIYKPITPCRAFDTRGIAKVPANSSRNFVVVGTSNFSSQGGPSTGCGIPDYAVAVSVSLTTINESGPGSITARAPASSSATATVLSYATNVPETASANVAVGSKRITLATVGGATNVYGDVTGYYAQQIAGMVAPDGSIYAGGTALVSAVKNSTGNYTVTVDRDVTYCSPFVTGYSGYVYASAYGFDFNKIQVYIWYLSGSTQTAYDTYFYISVHC